MSLTSRPLVGAACAAVLALALAGCGSGSGSPTTRDEPGDVAATPTAQVTGTPPAGAEIVRITLDGKSVDPNGERVKVDLDQPVVLRIAASEAGQLHVHSTPEQKIDFGKGDSEITLTFDVPGVVDVEDHALDKLIVQLEVS